MSEPIYLEIDAGNSRVKCRYRQSGSPVYSFAVEWADLCAACFDQHAAGNLASIYVASVADAVRTQTLLDVLSGYFPGVLLRHIKSEQGLGGLSLAYQNVGRLGVDRILAMIGARARKSGGVLVIDAGSALTADFLRHDGLHLGGYIFPGVRMQRNGLLHGTSFDVEPGERSISIVPGVSTETCVENAFSMIFDSLAKALEARARDLGLESVVMAGGDAAYFSQFFGMGVTIEPDLVLDGLASLASQEL